MISTVSEGGRMVRRDARNWMGRRCARRQCLDSRQSWTAIDVIRIKTMSPHLWKHLQGAGAAVQLWQSFSHFIRAAYETQETSVQSLGRKDPRGGNGNPLLFLPGKFHGQRSLAGYSPGGLKESDATEYTHIWDTRLVPREGLNSSTGVRMTLRSYYQTYSSFRESASYNYSGWLSNYW